MKHTDEIIYARAAIRNMIEADTTGDTSELELAIVCLDQAERHCQLYSGLGTNSAD